ncbi:efflux transporter outer membrane subunit [Chromobacterium haemolyticum]|uniref:efflux transporter outer membrane subunit n=1 Tax=Chromobacterium haemolyticum TaxID=394935 RepID=UPI0015C484F6|nr:efflux transporter outer membrane subunit [Chromobacterium haemolyticum]
MTLWKSNLTALGLALLLAACQSTPYQRQALETPAQWHSPTAQSQTDMSRESWWQGFGDAGLLAVQEQARSRNPDLSIALLKLRKAQLAAGLERSEALPSLSGDLSAGTKRTLGESSTWSRSSGGSLSTSYELDLWGRVDARLRAADQEFRASAYDEAAARLLSDSAAAGLYWDIAALKTRQRLGQADLMDLRRIQALAETKWRAGATSEQDVTQARSAVLSQQTELLTLADELGQKENALALLLDHPPGAALPPIAELPLEPALPAIDAGLPSSLLERRPDLMAAEARLRGQLAKVDQQRAALFPTLKLTGSLGSSSSALSSLVQNPLLTLGASLSLPFLEWRKQGLQLKSSQADYELETVNFRKTLYRAYQEVDNALSARQRLQGSARLQADALALSRRSEQLAESRYRAGAVDAQTWLDAAKARRSSESALVRLRQEQLKNLADVYKALGGAPAA